MERKNNSISKPRIQITTPSESSDDILAAQEQVKARSKPMTSYIDSSLSDLSIASAIARSQTARHTLKGPCTHALSRAECGVDKHARSEEFAFVPLPCRSSGP
ncbi:hypothetical protein ACJJTC_010981 [Scirpophaga incertulas]